MKSINFSKKSLHWRLASYYGPYFPSDNIDTDICTYSRAVLRGSLWVVVYLWAGMIAGGITGDFLAWVAAMGINGMRWIDPNPAAVVAGYLLGVILTLVIIAALMVLRDNIKERQRAKKYAHQYEKQDKPPTFLSEWYRKWKNKTCFNVKVE